MKSLKDISWDVTEDIYRADTALSYSTLSRFNREGFDNLAHLFDKTESPSLLFGSVVDCLLTGTKEEFEDRFFVADFPELPDKQKEIVDIVFHAAGGRNSWDMVSDDTILQAVLMTNYQPNWREETRVKVIREAGREYYDLLTLADGKTVITQRLYQDAVDCVDTLRQSDSTKWYFEPNNPFDNSIERLYQLKFRGEHNGVPLRCMADLIIVDYKNKIVYPCDLKTSFKPEWRFYKSFMEWGYWIQAQLYWYLIRQTMDRDEYFRDFKLADYRFIVISNRTRKPLVWTFPQTQAVADLEIGSYKLRNWRGIAEELNAYLTREHDVPLGIDTSLTNDISKWLEYEGTKSS